MKNEHNLQYANLAKEYEEYATHCDAIANETTSEEWVSYMHIRAEWNRYLAETARQNITEEETV